jgi:hypothetical protein
MQIPKEAKGGLHNGSASWAGIVCVFVNIPFGSFWFKKWDPVFMRENRRDDRQLAELGRVGHLVRLPQAGVEVGEANVDRFSSRRSA